MNALVQISGDLPVLIDKARALLDEGAALAAKELAGRAYNEAKDAVALGKRLEAAEGLIDRSRRLQGEALLIESTANITIADDWDRAQDDGTNSVKGGRPKTVNDEDGFTARDLGMSRETIRQARKLRDYEASSPGIIERTIAERIAQGVEPTRASIRGIGTCSASAEARGLDFYATSPEAVHALLALETFSKTIFEPACGNGAISRLMEASGYTVRLQDIVDRGCTDINGELQRVGDFLETASPAGRPVDIVTNPPFGIVNDFIAHAIRVFKPPKMAMLLNLNAMCGTENANRNFWMDEHPPSRIMVFARRLPMMHREGYQGQKNGSQMNTAWFIWEKGFTGHPRLQRIDWKQYQPQEGKA